MTEQQEQVDLSKYQKNIQKIKEFGVNFIKHPFLTAADVVFYMVSMTVAVWLIFSVTNLCWNTLKPFFQHQW